MNDASLRRHAAAIAVGGLPPCISVYDLLGDDRAAYVRHILDRTRRGVERVYGIPTDGGHPRGRT